MKTTISITKVITTTEKMEIEFPMYFKHKEAEIYKRFDSIKDFVVVTNGCSKDINSYNFGNIEKDISNADYFNCSADLFYEAYAMVRMYFDIKFDFSQTYLNLSDHD